MYYVSQYICWLIKKLDRDFSNRMMFYIRDSLIQHKADAMRRYFYTLKKILDLVDEDREMRNQHAVTIFLKVFNCNNVNTFGIDYNLEYVWLWFLRFSGANLVFRKKVQ